MEVCKEKKDNNAKSDSKTNTDLKEASKEQAELKALHKLDEKCVQYQQQGNYVAALENMERALVLRRHFFGVDSEEVIEACKAVGELCNLLSMTYLQQENYPVAYELLKKAEILTEMDPAGKAVTLNNMACYFRRLGKLHVSMKCLKKALSIETKLEKNNNVADTHLNLCAVFSQLGKHQNALEHAQSALILLQEELFSNKKMDNLGESKDRIAVLCIAYHNVGVEQEFLKKFAMSVQAYKKGVGIAECYLGSKHGVSTILRNSYQTAKRAQVGKIEKDKKKNLDVNTNNDTNKVKKNVQLERIPQSSFDEEKLKTKIESFDIPCQRSENSPNRIKTLEPLNMIERCNGSPLSPHDSFFSPRGSPEKKKNSSPKRNVKVKPIDSSVLVLNNDDKGFNDLITHTSLDSAKDVSSENLEPTSDAPDDNIKPGSILTIPAPQNSKLNEVAAIDTKLKNCDDANVASNDAMCNLSEPSCINKDNLNGMIGSRLHEESYTMPENSIKVDVDSNSSLDEHVSPINGYVESTSDMEMFPTCSNKSATLDSKISKNDSNSSITETNINDVTRCTTRSNHLVPEPITKIEQNVDLINDKERCGIKVDNQPALTSKLIGIDSNLNNVTNIKESMVPDDSVAGGVNKDSPNAEIIKDKEHNKEDIIDQSAVSSKSEIDSNCLQVETNVNETLKSDDLAPAALNKAVHNVEFVIDNEQSTIAVIESHAVTSKSEADCSRSQVDTNANGNIKSGNSPPDAMSEDAQVVELITDKETNKKESMVPDESVPRVGNEDTLNVELINDKLQNSKDVIDQPSVTSKSEMDSNCSEVETNMNDMIKSVDVQPGDVSENPNNLQLVGDTQNSSMDVIEPLAVTSKSEVDGNNSQVETNANYTVKSNDSVLGDVNNDVQIVELFNDKKQNSKGGIEPPAVTNKAIEIDSNNLNTEINIKETTAPENSVPGGNEDASNVELINDKEQNSKDGIESPAVTNKTIEIDSNNLNTEINIKETTVPENSVPGAVNEDASNVELINDKEQNSKDGIEPPVAAAVNEDASKVEVINDEEQNRKDGHELPAVTSKAILIDSNDLNTEINNDDISKLELNNDTEQNNKDGIESAVTSKAIEISSNGSQVETIIADGSPYTSKSDAPGDHDTNKKTESSHE